MSDSESSSDVENLFRIARQNAVAKLGGTKVDLTDNSDKSSDSEEEPKHSRLTRRKDPGSALKIIESRIKTRRKILTKDIDDSDSDSSEESPQQQKQQHAAPTTPATVLEVDLTISSDDDDETYNLQKRGSNKRTLDIITQYDVERLRRAKQELQSAQSYHGQNAPELYHQLSPTLAQSTAPITVKLSCRVQKLLSEQFIHKTIYISIHPNDTLQVLKEALLKELQLKSKSSSVAMSYQGSSLSWSRQVSEYSLSDGSEIHAHLMLSGVGDVSSVGNVALPVNKGKSISLVLRCKDQQDKLQMGCLETFKVLVEQYKQLKNLQSRSTAIILKFDGDKLSLNSTPKSNDMEDDDLIDVEIR